MSPRALYLTSERGLRGGERQVRLLGELLTREGWELGLCAPPGAALLQGWPGPTFAAPMANSLDPRGALAAWRAAGRFRPELVHAFTARAHALAGPAARGRPLVVTRSVAFEVRPGRRYRAPGTRYIAVSQAAAESLQAGGVAPGQVTVIPPGVVPRPPDREAGAALRAWLAGPGEFVVASVGALEPTKGYDLLLRALAALPGARLLLLGDGPERERLLALAAGLGVAGRAHLLRDGEASVEALLAAADAFCSSSRREGFGVALVEALAAGLPCVASDSGGVRDIVSEGTALLAPREDSGALAAALANIRADPALAARLRAAGPARAAQFGPARLARETLALYRAALEERST